MAKEVHIERTEKVLHLPCKLTSSEFVERAQALAQTTADIASEESRADSLKKQLNAKMAELEAKRQALSAVVQRGEEFRDVACEYTRDFDAGVVYTLRKDTGEIMDERPMRAEERQTKAAL